ncbi:putative FAD-binding oxidoreductase [Sporormia fimetaria CBS 119925]|uniref:FAD-binding oxidoreductase n=1 Tax=Sporormia fimetaria CBS 119925 TaxID=1340428 RepID=A0A6A6V3W1_9PLEO|nr:putative FAD-binding oxidoreductase [Sporormia fimetaria CBS 119925]
MISRLLPHSVCSLILLAHIALCRPLDTSDAVCQRLNNDYESTVFLPSASGYSEISTENWSNTADRTPSCVFRPDNAEDLSKVIRQLQKNRTKFAIRSGGHSPSPDAANINNGVLIDLAGFDQVEYDAARKRATIGTGLRWGKVYEELDKFGVTVVGGRVLDVGVGGLTLGSGLSYLSDMYGLACDNVINFEVVLGNGTIVDANQGRNEDLFWALKGGANNFGIVTRFTLSTYPVPQVWGGIKVYSIDKLPVLFKAMYEYQSVAVKDPKANLMLQGLVSKDTAVALLNLIYLAPEESPEAFAPFYHVEPLSDSTKISSLTEFHAGQGPTGFPPRVDWRSTSFTPDASLYEKLSQLSVESSALGSITNVDSGVFAFGMQPISTSTIEAGFARGGNALGLQNTNQTWWVTDAGWAKEADDDAVHLAVMNMVDAIQAEAEAADAHVPYIFMNDASYDQNVIGSYGADNVARLRAVSAKYDPHRVFQDLVPGGFKLPR